VKIVGFAVLALLLVGTAPQAKASFGCEVLLCLAASGGTPNECKPILRKLAKRLAKGKSFPSCKMESGPEIAGGNDNAGGNDSAGLPKTQRGVATYVPAHSVCTKWEYRRTVRGDPVDRYCPAENRKTYEAHYDHSGKSCRQWFPERKRNMRAGYGSSYTLYRQCRAKSKRFVRVTGDGIQGDYFYY